MNSSCQKRVSAGAGGGSPQPGTRCCCRGRTSPSSSWPRRALMARVWAGSSRGPRQPAAAAWPPAAPASAGFCRLERDAGPAPAGTHWRGAKLVRAETPARSRSAPHAGPAWAAGSAAAGAHWKANKQFISICLLARAATQAAASAPGRLPPAPGPAEAAALSSSCVRTGPVRRVCVRGSLLRPPLAGGLMPAACSCARLHAGHQGGLLAGQGAQPVLRKVLRGQQVCLLPGGEGGGHLRTPCRLTGGPRGSSCVRQSQLCTAGHPNEGQPSRLSGPAPAPAPNTKPHHSEQPTEAPGRSGGPSHQAGQAMHAGAGCVRRRTSCLSARTAASASLRARSACRQ